MTITRSWSRKLFARPPRTVRKAPASCRPRLEVLEDRLTPSGLNWLVSDSSDSVSDTGSLRYAIAQFNGDTTPNDSDSITFASSLAGKTITLGSTLELSNTTSAVSLEIDGSNAPG